MSYRIIIPKNNYTPYIDTDTKFSSLCKGVDMAASNIDIYHPECKLRVLIKVDNLTDIENNRYCYAEIYDDDNDEENFGIEKNIALDIIKQIENRTFFLWNKPMSI